MTSKRAEKTGKASHHVAATHKHVKLRAHHAKPYRKRHIGLLFISLAALVFLTAMLLSYRDQVITGIASSKTFVGDLFSQNQSYNAKVSSAYGFNLSYDQTQFYASAIDAQTGDLNLGTELNQERAYNIVRIAPNFSTGAANSSTTSALTMTLHPGKADANDTLEAIALQDGGLDAVNLTRLTTITATLGGQTFQKSTWQTKASTTLAPSLAAKFVTYSGLVRGDVVTIVISLGVGGGITESTYAPIINSISFDNSVSYVSAPAADVAVKVNASRSLLDTLTDTDVAAAATSAPDNLSGSEEVAALYTPAVVKIYNAYCMDVSIDGKPYLSGACSAESGSGFFISQDGYLGTNGHVADVTALDVVISDAISNYTTKGDPQYFNYLLSLTSLKQSDIPAGSTDDQSLGIMINAMYGIDQSRITETNAVQNLLVQVTDKNPDVATLLQDTQDRKVYSGDSSVLPAKVVAADYRANDGYNGFKASDVAIIKVDGSNFPIVSLGSIDSVAPGADLSILGYPGEASDNGIVDSTSSEATLTTGKVSSIKTADGSTKKLIETDTVIGHGNSGGPALDDNGQVVGIATYTVDGSGQGNGVFNYIRDIKDLTDLATASNIKFDTNSETQAQWTQGLSYYYTSHYSKALKNFDAVQSLYPNDSGVASFIASSQKHIAAGDDVVDFPLVPVIIAAAVIFVGIGAAIFLIVRHHKKHIIYNAAVAQGAALPVGSGVGTQSVYVAQGTPATSAPIVSAILPTPGAQYAPQAQVPVVPLAATVVPIVIPVSQESGPTPPEDPKL
jgi:S1-C subfamily serine protease